jgi:nucleoside 2-deoxyribosyltransferase
LESKLLPTIENAGYVVLDPWKISSDLGGQLAEAYDEKDVGKLKEKLHSIDLQISQRNEGAIKESNLVVAVLDGQEVDSGVAAEVGFAYCLRKTIFGYRGDFRLSGDNLGVKVNLQIDAWIQSSGGKILTTLDELGSALWALKSQAKL